MGLGPHFQGKSEAKARWRRDASIANMRAPLLEGRFKMCRMCQHLKFLLLSCFWYYRGLPSPLKTTTATAVVISTFAPKGASVSLVQTDSDRRERLHAIFSSSSTNSSNSFVSSLICHNFHLSLDNIFKSGLSFVNIQTDGESIQ